MFVGANLLSLIAPSMLVMTCFEWWPGSLPIPSICCFRWFETSCVPKRELQFLNNPDPTHNFLSTLTTKSAVPVDTDNISTCVWSRPPPALMSQSMTKQSADSTHDDATDFARCNVCLADVQLEAVWRPTKRHHFPFVSRQLALETIPTIYHKSVTLCCLAWLRVNCRQFVLRHLCTDLLWMLCLHW